MASKTIQLDSWERKAHYQFFTSSTGSVRLSLTQPLDVTGLVAYSKLHCLSFYYSFIFLVTQTANEIPSFRQRIENGEPVEYESLDPLFTDLNTGNKDDRFKLVMGKMLESLSDFVCASKAQSQAQAEHLPIADFMGRYDILNITCYPWGDFSNLQVKPVQHDNQDAGIPFIAWDQYQKKVIHQDLRYMLSLQLDVSHCFLDAIHLFQFKCKLEEKINALYL